MPKAATIQGIIKEAKTYLPRVNEERLLQAYEFAKKAHEGQLRNSGEPYIQHPLEVTKILLSLKPDEDSIVAALLHDVLEDTDVTPESVGKTFGESLMPILKGLEKLGKVYYRGEERQVENLRKMFIAMANDLRVILIKLADRLHNMRTLEHVPEHKRERIAKETLTVYAPIAARLGIYHIKNELDDLCFYHLQPAEFKRVQTELDELTGVQQNIIKISRRILLSALKKAGIKARIEGRIKHIYSIYRKLQRKGKNYVTELYDVLALRIIVDSEAECYQALGVIHKSWTPLTRRFKDYIAVPKPNGYQSLHTTLIGLCPDLHNQPIEIQIRTEEMDTVAKYGIAAHWQYKERGGRAIAIPREKIAWVQSLVALHESLQSNQEFVETLNVDVFHDRIFALTPEGDVFDLPADATPVDFAYHVHTDVGNRCRGAKVNGGIVPLTHRLKNGDVVEIVTSPTAQPNRYWLSFVVTSCAKQRIKQWFNSQDCDQLIRLGKDLLNEQLKRYGQKPLDPKLTPLKTLDGQKLTIKEREQVLEKIGNNSEDAVAVVKKILPPSLAAKTGGMVGGDRPAPAPAVQVASNTPVEILITGEKGYKTQFASCCQPQVDTPIVGYVTRGRGVTVHDQNCSVLKGLDGRRLVRVSWSTEKKESFEATLKLLRQSRIGLLRDVAEVFASNQLSIVDIKNLRPAPGGVGVMFIAAVFDRPSTLPFIMDQLLQIPGILKVEEAES